MNRAGKANVLLLPNEDAYVEFLRVKKVPIQKWKGVGGGEKDKKKKKKAAAAASKKRKAGEEPEEEPEEPEDAEMGEGGEAEDGESAMQLATSPAVIEAEVRVLAKADRDVMEKGQRAFVSYVRAYKEHQCSFIFVHHQLPYAALAQSWGLLFFPQMSDLKHLHVKFEAEEGLKPYHIKYKDVHREKQRVKNLDADMAKKQEEKKVREEKEEAYRKKKEKAGPKRRVKRHNKEIREEWDELAIEARYLKKLKAGKITPEEYEAAVNGGADD